jgi:proteasome accessory factor B
MADTLPLLRQWSVLKTLSARRHGATLRELAEEANVTQKTISRDLALLRHVGFPIREIVGPHGRKQWTLAQDGGTIPLGFTLEEAAALYLGRQFLEGLAGTLFWSGARSAFCKIQASLGDSAARYLSKLASSLYLTTHALADYTSRAELIDQLMVAIEDRKLTVITYQSLRSTEPVTLYDVHPYALVHHRGALYVIGWSKDHNQIRTFKVDRISAVDVQTGLQFARPDDFDPARYLEHSFGIFTGDGPPQTVRVRFAAPVVRILQEKRFHPSQQLSTQPDGSVIAKYDLSAFEEFTSWVLSFGPHAEVLEPREVRERVRQAVACTLEKYRPINSERDQSLSPMQDHKFEFSGES